MGKFKREDKVRVIKTNDIIEMFDIELDDVGSVIQVINITTSEAIYLVLIDDYKVSFYEDQLELINE